MAKSKLQWPGDILETLGASCVTHAMLGITEVEQLNLVAKRRIGGREGRDAAIKIETARRLVIKWLSECDLYEVMAETDGTGPNGDGPQGHLMRPSGVFRSRWIGDYERAINGPTYGNWKDGAPDDHLKFISDNFDEFFQTMRLFVPRRIGSDVSARKALDAVGMTPDLQAQYLQAGPKYEANLNWFSIEHPKARLEAARMFEGEPLDSRLPLSKAVVAATNDEENPSVHKAQRGRPRGAKDTKKRTEKGMKALNAFKARRDQSKQKANDERATTAVIDDAPVGEAE